MDDHPNLELFMRAFAAFGAADMDTLSEVFDEHVVWHSPGASPLSGEHRGQEATFGMMEGGNQVAVEFVLEADLPAFGGGHYSDEEMHLWTFNDAGKVVRLRHYIDTAKHIAAFSL